MAETFRECLHDHLDLPRLQATAGRHPRRAGSRSKTCRLETPSPFAAGLLFAFTAAYMYQYDATDARAGTTGGLWIGTCWISLLGAAQAAICSIRGPSIRWSAVCAASASRRARATEMAEWLRRLGDLTPAELEGPMAEFLEELEADGRAAGASSLPASLCPALVVRGGRGALSTGIRAGGSTPSEQAAGGRDDPGPLSANACPGRSDGRAWPAIRSSGLGAAQAGAMGGAAAGVVVARRRTNRTSRCSGRLRPIWSRCSAGTLALLRREVITCPPPQFVDFVLRWQGVHPDTRRRQRRGPPRTWSVCRLAIAGRAVGADGLAGRVPGYQPRWLDEGIGERRMDVGLSGRGEIAAPVCWRFLRREDLADCRLADHRERRPLMRCRARCWSVCSQRGTRSSATWPAERA